MDEWKKEKEWLGGEREGTYGDYRNYTMDTGGYRMDGGSSVSDGIVLRILISIFLLIYYTLLYICCI